MSDTTTPKPGLLALADSPEDAAAKLVAAIEAENASAAAPFAAIITPATGSEAAASTTSTTQEA